VKRREFITLIGGAAAWPLAARAQQSQRVRRVGVLRGYAESNREGQAFVAAFREGLQKLGWSENRNLRIDTRWAISDDADSIQRYGDAATNAHYPSRSSAGHHCAGVAD
jgi:putative tryptophan/tyrosine transport system substrate-binding protein